MEKQAGLFLSRIGPLVVGAVDEIVDACSEQVGKLAQNLHGDVEIALSSDSQAKLVQASLELEELYVVLGENAQKI